MISKSRLEHLTLADIRSPPRKNTDDMSLSTVKRNSHCSTQEMYRNSTKDTHTHIPVQAHTLARACSPEKNSSPSRENKNDEKIKNNILPIGSRKCVKLPKFLELSVGRVKAGMVHWNIKILTHVTQPSAKPHPNPNHLSKPINFPF